LRTVRRALQGKPAPAKLEVTNRLLYPLALTMVAGTVGAWCTG
jgi:hypothetical protein